MRRTLAPAYVLTVVVVAICGFVLGSTGAIALAALLALPTSVPAIVGYYVVYGLLALVPGANPSSSTGSGACSPGAVCQQSSSGDLATWFAVTTGVVGVLALTAAALLNVLVLRKLTGHRRPVDNDFVAE
jgi:hypothetical protein